MTEPRFAKQRRWVTAEVLTWRARRRRVPRGLPLNLGLVLLGMGGAIMGGWLVGWWMMGLVVMAESGMLMFIGFNRDDGADMPVRGARTPGQVLADEAEAQRRADELEQ